MTISLRSCRLSVIILASVFAAIALVVAFLVIPPVKADTSPLARPEVASTAFWVSAALFLLVATALFALAQRITRGGFTGGLIAIAVLTLLLSLALWDAANAFQSHNAALQTADALLFICAFAGGLGSIVLMTVVFFLRRLKKTSKEQPAVSSTSTDV